jgi:hypothetical protein
LAPETLAQATQIMLATPVHADAARQLGKTLQHYDSAERFRATVAEILS